ncbi:MAG: hypothetical protein EA365_08780 [Gloeocapsa sp. DLM2.Bin57]|nr:MAG: hypothetical protein EA365_08780 [Gloeocapsa sp. DLM2.Bin57]
MSRIKVVAGDFLNDESDTTYINIYNYFDKTLTLKTALNPKGEVIHRSAIAEIAIANEENVTNIGGKIFWGVTGSLLLGPIGLAAGLLAGGKEKKMAFILKLEDGRTLVGVTDSNTYNELLGGTVESPSEQTEKRVEEVQKSVNGEGGGGCGIGCLAIVIIGIFLLAFIGAVGSETLPFTSSETTEDVQEEENSSETYQECETRITQEFVSIYGETIEEDELDAARRYAERINQECHNN